MITEGAENGFKVELSKVNAVVASREKCTDDTLVRYKPSLLKGDGYEIRQGSLL